MAQGKKLIQKFDTAFRFVIEHNPALAPWADLLRDYWAAELPGKTGRTAGSKATALIQFSIGYLDGLGLSHLTPKQFFAVDQALPSLASHFGVDSAGAGITAKRPHDIVIDFLDWVLRERLAVVDTDGQRVVPPHLAMPFERVQKKVHDKQGDLDFLYVLKRDPTLEDWRALAAEWLKDQAHNVAGKRDALDLFLVGYLHGQNLERNFGRFLLRETPKPDFMAVRMAAKSKGADRIANHDTKHNNAVSEFLDWVLTTKLGDEGIWDVTRFHNPVPKLSAKGLVIATESDKNVLSIRYIKECRGLLAEGLHFRDWTWAHAALDGGSGGGDWFVVDPQRVDRNDPDCVWRQRETTQYERKEKGYPDIVTELWSPVRAVALYVKLELPLRLMQVRMLDSGEADTYRYELNPTGGGHFVLNHGAHATGNAKRPYMRGVFHRTQGATDAGLFINTNKTADIDKAESGKGYVIPWAHATVLYWLTKLRDWQAKYNPVSAPARWTDLTRSHFNATPPHPSVLAQRGTACFLFRNPRAKRPDLPIQDDAVDKLWRKLLERLEAICAERGEPMAFVVPDSRALHFPLHALRVSLISYLVLDLGLPLPIVSKLVAGHATIIMTLHYTKFGRAMMNEVMEAAERNVLEADQQNHRRFLQNATYEQIKTRFASISDDAFRAAVGTPGAGLIFDDKGICPVGGAMCDVGGERLSSEKAKPTYAPVPGYPRERNCTRCRFFLTGPCFLAGLAAHFNAVSERAHRASTQWHELEQRQNDLEEERQAAEQRNAPFLKALDIERIEQRCQEAEENFSKHMNDMLATNHLIRRSIEIRDSEQGSEGVKLVANGTLQDLSVGFIEAESEMHQLEVVCQNAEIYVNPEATPAILRRGQLLDRMLMFNRMPPVLMHMDEKTQLMMGNALMQLIKARTGSIAGSLPYAECQKRLSELGIRPRELEAEMTRIVGTAEVQQLIARAKAIGAGPDREKEQE